MKLEEVQGWSMLIGGVIMSCVYGIAKAVVMLLDWKHGASKDYRTSTIKEYQVLLDRQKEEIDDIRKVSRRDVHDLRDKMNSVALEREVCSRRLDMAFYIMGEMRNILVANGMSCPEWKDPLASGSQVHPALIVEEKTTITVEKKDDTGN